ncbi:MAG: anion permease, partial [Bdellovibrionales bacterium]|nr:anion permease [Bdellovibrionales bacterium]
MTLQIGLLFLLLALMVYLFLSEKLPLEITAFTGLLLLTFTGVVNTTEAFSGFSSPAFITLFSMFFISTAFRVTGLADSLGRYILRLTNRGERSVIATIMLVAGGFSAFLSNIAVTGIFLPAATGISRMANVSPSRIF